MALPTACSLAVAPGWRGAGRTMLQQSPSSCSGGSLMPWEGWVLPVLGCECTASPGTAPARMCLSQHGQALLAVLGEGLLSS